jgi:hypothetical protein
MRSNRLTQVMLVVIASSVGTIALRRLLTPTTTQAQSSDIYRLYVEPGTRMLRAPDDGRQVLGKVVVDLCNGNIWGFPTLAQEPYHIEATGNTKHLHHTRSCWGSSISLLQINKNTLRRAAWLRLTNRRHTFATRSGDATPEKGQVAGLYLRPSRQ